MSNLESEIKKLERRIASIEAEDLLAEAEVDEETKDEASDGDLAAELEAMLTDSKEEDDVEEETPVEEPAEEEDDVEKGSDENIEGMIAALEGVVTAGKKKAPKPKVEDEESEESEESEEEPPKKKGKNVEGSDKVAVEMQTYNRDGMADLVGKKKLSMRENGKVAEKGTYIRKVNASLLKEASARLDKVAAYLEKKGNDSLALRVDKIALALDKYVETL